jgi:hypothetical protein
MNMKKTLLSSIAAGTLLLGACGTTETDSAPDTSASMISENVMPLSVGQQFWFSHKGENKTTTLVIEILDESGDENEMYYQASFTENDSLKGSNKYIWKTSEGYSLSNSIRGDLTLILPDSIPSDSGSFGKETPMDYTWKDDQFTTLFENDSLLFNFDKIVYEKNKGFVELTERGENSRSGDYSFLLDSTTTK